MSASLSRGDGSGGGCRPAGRHSKTWSGRAQTTCSRAMAPPTRFTAATATMPSTGVPATTGSPAQPATTRLSGHGGNDVVDGGVGVDAASFAASVAAVSVNLTTGLAAGEGVDRLVGIDSVIGSRFDDVLTGNAGANTIRAGRRRRLDHGPRRQRRGRWRRRGRHGELRGVRRGGQCQSERGTAAGEGVDRLVGIDSVVGSRFDDVLTGNTGANTIRGGGGNDSITGRGGNDVVDGGVGVDTARLSRRPSRR